MLSTLRTSARAVNSVVAGRQAAATFGSQAVRHVSSGSEIVEKVRKWDGHETEFVQAVTEVVPSLEPVFSDSPEYLNIMERLVEPERVISFRVPWLDDNGNQHVNRGWRVQFNSAIGPYKGGLRFHPSVNQGILKFLGFEQIFKNALTTLPMGGGKGGSNFDPKGKSDREVYAFCTSFMTELQRHISAISDVPAGDIGVGGREIGYLYGTYKRVKNVGGENGVLTGKGLEYGGSLIRPEATGYGAVYFGKHMTERLLNKPYTGALCAVSGSGNVSQYTIEKLLDFGAKPISCSDSRGTLYVPNGITRELLADLMILKNQMRLPLNKFDCAKHAATGAVYVEGKKPWEVVEKVDCVFPSACENEINKQEAEALCKKGAYLVSEGANMPSTNDAIEVWFANDVAYGPGKAANAGGVAVSGLEMAQNALFLPWSREEVDGRLQEIMTNIFNNCVKHSQMYGFGDKNLQAGANIAGFLKVANAMNQQGHY